MQKQGDGWQCCADGTAVDTGPCCRAKPVVRQPSSTAAVPPAIRLAIHDLKLSQPTLDEHPFFEAEQLVTYCCQDGHKTTRTLEAAMPLTIVCAHLTSRPAPDALVEPRYCGKPANLVA